LQRGGEKRLEGRKREKKGGKMGGVVLSPLRCASFSQLRIKREEEGKGKGSRSEKGETGHK